MVGNMDQVFKLYCATVYGAIAPILKPITRARSYGYRKGASVDDCFSVLFESLCFAVKWGAKLVLGAQDVETAFDSVEHVDALRVLRTLERPRIKCWH